MYEWYPFDGPKCAGSSSTARQTAARVCIGVLDTLRGGNYEPVAIYDPLSDIECYYLANGAMAIGWVHNRNAWTMNNFYLDSGTQNFFGCEPPNSQPQQIAINGLLGGVDYYTHWFPTRMNTTVCPLDALDDDQDNTVVLHIDVPSTATLGGILNNYLDTVHADYAFIISPYAQVKSLRQIPAENTLTSDWDFIMYPNPATEELYLLFSDEQPKSIELLDLSGRLTRTWSNVTSTNPHLSLGELAKGLYWVRVSDGARSRVRKLIMQ